MREDEQVGSVAPGHTVLEELEGGVSSALEICRAARWTRRMVARVIQPHVVVRIHGYDFSLKFWVLQEPRGVWHVEKLQVANVAIDLGTFRNVIGASA